MIFHLPEASDKSMLVIVKRNCKLALLPADLHHIKQINQQKTKILGGFQFISGHSVVPTLFPPPMVYHKLLQ